MVQNSISIPPTHLRVVTWIFLVLMPLAALGAARRLGLSVRTESSLTNLLVYSLVRDCALFVVFFQLLRGSGKLVPLIYVFLTVDLGIKILGFATGGGSTIGIITFILTAVLLLGAILYFRLPSVREHLSP